MLETAERLTSEEGEPAVQQFLLLVVGCVRWRTAITSPGYLDSFLLRSLAVAGWAPSFDECARCGAPARTARSTPLLAVRCALTAACRGTPAFGGDAGAHGRIARRGLGGCRCSTSRQRRDAAGVTSAYLQWHLEATLAVVAACRTLTLL